MGEGLPTLYDPAGVYEIGGLMVLEGKRYRITRKTQRNMAVERYYWWHALWARVSARFGWQK